MTGLLMACRYPQLVVSDPLTGYGSSTITDSRGAWYTSGTFPAGGTSTGSNPSSIWEADTGGFYGDSGYGYTGLPTAVGHKYFFRTNTRDFSVKNQLVRFKYKSAALAAGGYPVDGTDDGATNADAVDIWFRFQTQYNLYILQFDRADREINSSDPERIYVKRKVPAYNWTGPGGNGALDNKGRYYYVPCDQGGFYQTWSALGLSEMAHDSSTVYQFEATCVTIAAGKVQFKLWRDGVFCGSWTDDNNNGQRDNGPSTLATDVSAGYFTAVTGYQSSWYQPIDLPGATGWRSDNRKCWFQDFELYNLG